MVICNKAHYWVTICMKWQISKYHNISLNGHPIPAPITSIYRGYIPIHLKSKIAIILSKNISLNCSDFSWLTNLRKWSCVALESWSAVIRLCRSSNHWIQGNTAQCMDKGAVQKLAHTSMISRTLWPSATSNHGGLRSRIGGPVTSMMLWPMATTNCGGLWPQISVYDFRKRSKRVWASFWTPPNTYIKK